MNKSRLLGAVCAFASLFVFASSNAASYSGFSGPGTVTIAGGGPNISFDVSFDATAPITLFFDHDTPLPETFGLDITNNTGSLDWVLFAIVLHDTSSTSDAVFVGNTNAWNENKNPFVKDILSPQSITFDYTGTVDTGWLSIAGQLQFPETLPTDHSFSLELKPNLVSNVPIPAAVWLFGSGLLGLIGMARRKKAT